jgi:hypothetical protein
MKDRLSGVAVLIFTAVLLGLAITVGGAPVP